MNVIQKIVTCITTGIQAGFTGLRTYTCGTFVAFAAGIAAYAAVSGIRLHIDAIAPAKRRGALFARRIENRAARKIGLNFAEFFAFGYAFVARDAHLGCFANVAASAAVLRVFGQFGAILLIFELTNRLIVCAGDRTFALGADQTFVTGMATFPAVILIGIRLDAFAPACDHAFYVITGNLGILAFAGFAYLIGIAFLIAFAAMVRIAAHIEAGVTAAADRTSLAARGTTALGTGIAAGARIGAQLLCRLARKIAGNLRFAAIGHIAVAVKVTVAARTAAIGTVGIVAAHIPFTPAILAIALGIDAFAVADQSIIWGASGRAFTGLAGLAILASCRTIAAVFGIRLNIDALAIAPFLTVAACFLTRHTGIVHADFAIETGIAAGAAVVLIVFGIDANAVAAGIGTAGMAADGKSIAASQGIFDVFRIIAAGRCKTSECDANRNRITDFMFIHHEMVSI